MEQFEALYTQVRSVWNRLSRLQQASIVGAILITAGVLAAIANSGQSPAYAVLYRGLSEADASGVVARLKEQKLPYQLADGGATISVPRSRVDDVRLDMAGAGLPKSTVSGYESLNQGGLAALGQTAYTQRQNQQRALESELARTISRLDAVEQVRVHLAIPEPSLFVEQDRPVTASVVLKVRSGQALDGGQVTGIVNLVARSVEGLKAENVSVVDTRGEVLSDAAVGNSAANSRQYQVQRTLEKNLERDIQTMLQPVLGANKAVVRVNASLNWDQVQAESEVYSTPAAGAPKPAAGSTASELSRTAERVVKAPGAIERLSVAVFLDGPMDESRVDAIQRAVAAAAGVNTQRGDAITVTSLPFEKMDPESATSASAQAEQIALTANIVRAAALLAVLVLGIIAARAVLPRRAPRLASVGDGPTRGLPQPVGTAPTGDWVSQPVPGDLRRRALVEERVVTIARSDPQLVAELIKGWLQDDEIRRQRAALPIRRGA